MHQPRESSRMREVQPPVIPIVAELIRAHPGTISLGQGVAYYGPPMEAEHALVSFLADPENHKYKAVDGIAPLREALTRKLGEENRIRGLGESRRLVVTAGGNMAFQNAVLAIADVDDEVILPTPYYFNHEMAVRIAGCRPVLVPTDARHQLQLDAIRAAITERTRAVVTISPNNPTGAVYPESDLRAVNALCNERGVYHVHDEAYEYFTYDGAKHFSPGSIGDDPFTICLYSLSKSYGFASWRIGSMVIPAHLYDAVRKVQDTILICPPVVSQFAAVGAMEAGRAYCDEHRRPIERVRHALVGELARLGDLCDVPPAQGAFYFFVTVRTGMGAMELVERLVRDHGVAVIPGTTFGVEDHCAVRMSYGALGPQTALEGVGRLVKGLRQIVRR